MAKPPELVVFDIDATLLKPQIHTTIEKVRESLFDDKLLTSFLEHPERYQVAIASFNSGAYPTPPGQPIGGRALGRAILDLQHPTGDSRGSVEDDFIQAWMHTSWENMHKLCKDVHLQFVQDAYVKKYGCRPPVIHFFDDVIENAYKAGKRGVRAYWVSEGVTRQNINSFRSIGNRVLFGVSGKYDHISGCIREFVPYLRRLSTSPNTSPVYAIYLPSERERAKTEYARMVQQLNGCTFSMHVIQSDINHIA